MPTAIRKNIITIIVAVTVTKVFLALREIVFTGYFGVNEVSDIYFFSILIPIFLFGTISGSFNYFFIPNYLRIKTAHGEEEALKYIFILLKFFCGALAIITLVMGWFLPPLLSLLNIKILSGPVAIEQFIYLSKLASIFFFFLTLSSLISSILQAEHYYLASIAPQVFIYLLTILGIVLGAKNRGISSVLYGAILGTLITNLILIYFLRKKFMRFLGLSNKGMVISHNHHEFIVVVFALIFAGLSPLVDQYMASTLLKGDLTVFFYGTLIPNGISEVLATSIGISIFSYSSAWFAQNEIEKLEHTSRKIISKINFVVIPFCIVLSLLAYPIISILFVRGAFTQESAIRVSEVLFWQSYSIYFIVLAILGTKIISSMGKNNLLLPLALIFFLLKVIFNIIFISLWKLKGIVIATLITHIINVLLILGYLAKQKVFIFPWKYPAKA